MNDIMTKEEIEVIEESSDLTAIKGTLNEYRERIELLEKRNTELSDEVSALKNNLKDHVDTHQISDKQLEELKRLGGTIIFSMLGDRDSEEYQAHYKIFFGHLWRDVRREFHLSKISHLPQKYFLDAMDFVERWSPEEGVQGLVDEHDRAMVAKKKHDLEVFLQAAAQMNQEAKRAYD